MQSDKAKLAITPMMEQLMLMGYFRISKLVVVPGVLLTTGKDLL